MIRVTIELLPHGSELHKRHLGTMEISNDGSGGTGTTGSYNVRLSKRGLPAVLWRRARVEGFPRKLLGAYDLVYRAFAASVGMRNPGAEDSAPTPEEEEANY